MMKQSKLLLTLFLALGLSASAAGVKRSGNFVTVSVEQPEANGAQLVRLQVVNDNIIRVQSTAEKAFPKKHKSLMIVDQKAKPQFSVKEEGGKVIVTAKNVRAEVEKKSGRVVFFDAQGKQLLKETAQQGKTFERFTVPEREIGVGTLTEQERNAWTWHMQFDSPADEAFYGLGQHQAEDFNYKGINEELYQYNTKVSIPFVISNKNYGLLWDSYSYCRWGNPNDYQQLHRAFTIYNKGGNKGSLTGTYVDARGKKLVREEDSIYFENSETIGNLPKGFKLQGAKVVYEGFLQAPQSYNYRFILYYAGYIRVFIGGREVVAERWRTAWNPNSWKFTCDLVKGKKTPIRIEWEPDGGESYCGLRAAVPQSDEVQNRLSVWSEMARDMDYYFIAGNNFDEIISGYRTLTGKAQIMPKWVLGFWQSRERYKSSADIEQTLSEFRKRKVPVDNIVQDWNYWKLDSWGDHKFESSRFPNPQAMLDSVHAMGGRFMISVWPKFYCTVDNYKALDKKGWIYQQAVKPTTQELANCSGSR